MQLLHIFPLGPRLLAMLKAWWGTGGCGSPMRWPLTTYLLCALPQCKCQLDQCCPTWRTQRLR